MRRITHLALALVLAVVFAVAAAPYAGAANPHPCWPDTADRDFRQVIPVLPGYCLVSVRASKPEPGTGTRGVVTYHGASAVVKIFRGNPHAWHYYRYVRAR